MKLQLINMNTVGHRFLHKPAEPVGHLRKLKMWEAKARGTENSRKFTKSDHDQVRQQLKDLV